MWILVCRRMVITNVCQRIHLVTFIEKAFQDDCGRFSGLFRCKPSYNEIALNKGRKMGNSLKSCILNYCHRLQISSISSMVTSSEDEDTDCTVETVNGHQKLPWNENYWSIKVTHVVSPNEIWAILSINAVNTKCVMEFSFDILIEWKNYIIFFRIC